MKINCEYCGIERYDYPFTKRCKKCGKFKSPNKEQKAILENLRKSTYKESPEARRRKKIILLKESLERKKEKALKVKEQKLKKEKHKKELNNTFNSYKEKIKIEKLKSKQDEKDFILLAKFFSDKEVLQLPNFEGDYNSIKLFTLQDDINIIKNCYYINLEKFDTKKDVIQKTIYFVNNDINHFDEVSQNILNELFSYTFFDVIYENSTLIMKVNSFDELKKIDENSKNKRNSIPQNVKDKVWNRDNGKCVQCGSNKNLEFDHIIPHSKGGANTYRNIQLLCESCNRSKSANIG